MYQISTTAVLYLVSAFSILLLGTYILVQNVEDAGNRAFFFLSLAAAFWLSGTGFQISAVTPETALLWNNVWRSLGATGIAPLFLVLVSTILGHNRVRHLVNILVSAMFLGLYLLTNTTSLGITEIQRMPYGYYPRFGLLGDLFIGAFLVVMGAVTVELISNLHSLEDELRQKQIRLFLGALAVASLGATDFLPCFGLHWYPIGWAAILGFALILGYGMKVYGGAGFESTFPYSLVLHALPTFVIGVDLNRQIRFVNASVERATDFKRGTLHGSSLETLLPDSSLLNLLDRPGEGPEIIERESYLRTVKREVIPIRLRMMKAMSRGFHIGYIINALDMREQRALEHQLFESQKMDVLGQLAGGIAHDFNNVMTTIHGATKILEMELHKKPGLPADDRRYFEMIESSIERGKTVTERMLTFSRTEEPEFHPVSAMSYLKDVQTLARHSLKESVTVTVDPFGGNDLILADKGQIQQVLLNLCINAADAMPGGGTIRLGLQNPSPERVQRCAPESDRQFLCIYVADEGIGMDEHTLQRIFDPFFTTKEAGRGTGLGLTTVKKIVRNHGGWIDVESAPGRGTTFYVGLPHPTKPAELKSFKIHKEVPQGNGEHLLIVEDEAALQTILREFFTNENYTVSVANDGIQALKIYEKQAESVDVIITDLGLPRMTGQELIRELQKRAPHLPIIATTGYFDPEQEARLKAKGFKHILYKPVDIGEINRVVTQVLSEKP